MSKQLLRSLQEIMTALLDEATTLPEGLLEDILLQQLNVHYDVRSSFAGQKWFSLMLMSGSSRIPNILPSASR
jgi:hypothetical protein